MNIDNQIPKIIHYAWFGNTPKPKYLIDNLNSWKKACPDYQIIEWNETNFDVGLFDYTREAFFEKKYAFVSDFLRIYAVYNYGGIYLDTDVNLEKDFSPFLDYSFFTCFENKTMINLAVFGAKKEDPRVKKLLDYYSKLSFYKDKKKKKKNLLPITFLISSFMKNLGFKLNGKTQTLDNFLILSSEYYFPLDCVSKKIYRTDNTRGVHQYAFSWADDFRVNRDKLVRFLRIILGKYIFEFFENVYLKIWLFFYNKKIRKVFKKAKRL